MSGHRELVRRWFAEVWDQGREASIDALMSEDVVAHGLGEGGADVVGRDGFKRFWRTFRGALPDIRCTVEEVVSEGDLAAWRLTASATHRGDQLGVAGTGRPVRFEAMGFVRVRDGRIVEGWNLLDMLGLLEQVGAASRRRAA